MLTQNMQLKLQQCASGVTCMSQGKVFVQLVEFSLGLLTVQEKTMLFLL